MSLTVILWYCVISSTVCINYGRSVMWLLIVFCNSPSMLCNNQGVLYVDRWWRQWRKLQNLNLIIWTSRSNSHFQRYTDILVASYLDTSIPGGHFILIDVGLGIRLTYWQQLLFAIFEIIGPSTSPYPSRNCYCATLCDCTIAVTQRVWAGTQDYTSESLMARSLNACTL